MLIHKNDVMPPGALLCIPTKTQGYAWHLSCMNIARISLCVPTAPSSHRHNECQIWPGGLQQFTEAHFNLHPIVHRGDVAPHKVCGGAEGAGNQPKQLQFPHTVLHLRGWSLRLLPHLWIPAGNTGGKTRSESTHTHVVKYLNIYKYKYLIS